MFVQDIFINNIIMIYIIAVIIKELDKVIKKKLHTINLYIWSLMYIVLIHSLKEGPIFKI